MLKTIYCLSTLQQYSYFFIFVQPGIISLVFLYLPFPVIHLLIEIKSRSHIDIAIDIHSSIGGWSISTICKTSKSDMFNWSNEWRIFIHHSFWYDIFSLMDYSCNAVFLWSSGISSTGKSSSRSSCSHSRL